MYILQPIHAVVVEQYFDFGERMIFKEKCKCIIGDIHSCPQWNLKIIFEMRRERDYLYNPGA